MNKVSTLLIQKILSKSRLDALFPMSHILNIDFNIKNKEFAQIEHPTVIHKHFNNIFFQ
jgi:hypothetical protein